MVISENETHKLIAAVEQGAAERVAAMGMDEAHTISFACGAMVLFNALGIWERVPMKWHLYAQAGRDPFTGVGLPTTEPDTWPVVSVTKGDLASQGFDVSEVDETEMQNIANVMHDNEHFMRAYWAALVAAAEMEDLPQLEEVEESANDNDTY